MRKICFHTFVARVRQFAAPSRCLTTLALLSASLLCAVAQDTHAHMDDDNSNQRHNKVAMRAP